MSSSLISLCKRRGFIYQSSEVYGGLQGVYDYGPLGVELKNNLKVAWWKSMVYDRDDVEGLDSAILTHRLTLRHSGHEATFSDPMVDCRKCRHRMRTDHVKSGRCDHCNSADLTESKNFNLMFKSNFGPVQNDESYVYLRPETAQGIFANFKNVLDSTARKLPFGIAQIGKAFRNEITPRNFIFRVREFEQMELEFFVEPGTDETWHSYWVEERVKWWHKQGISPKNLQRAEQAREDLSHYSKATVDLVYEFPHGLEELEGIANRTDYDLGSHTKNQGEFSIQARVLQNHSSITSLDVNGVIPFVIEPSAGLDRGVFAILHEAYAEEELESGATRTVLKLKPHLAPVKVAVIPLAKNNEAITSAAKQIVQTLRSLIPGRVRYEDTGNIGKAYRRNDEIGTPYCVTVDFETVESGNARSVTVRDRDSMQQTRIDVEALPGFLLQSFHQQ